MAPKLQCVLFTSINSLSLLTYYVKSAFFVLTFSKFVSSCSEHLVVVDFRDDLVGTSSRLGNFLSLHDFERIKVSFLLVSVSLMLLTVELGVFLLLSPEHEDRDNEQKEADGGEDEAHALPEGVIISIGAASSNVNLEICLEVPHH